jgi:chromosome segregation ATPase
MSAATRKRHTLELALQEAESQLDSVKEEIARAQKEQQERKDLFDRAQAVEKTEKDKTRELKKQAEKKAPLGEYGERFRDLPNSPDELEVLREEALAKANAVVMNNPRAFQVRGSYIKGSLATV